MTENDERKREEGAVVWVKETASENSKQSGLRGRKNDRDENEGEDGDERRKKAKIGGVRVSTRDMLRSLRVNRLHDPVHLCPSVSAGVARKSLGQG